MKSVNYIPTTHWFGVWTASRQILSSRKTVTIIPSIIVVSRIAWIIVRQTTYSVSSCFAEVVHVILVER